MSRIDSIFKPKYRALIAYITVGYPDIEATPRIAAALAESGCDIIELGIPFSDPLADGTTWRWSGAPHRRPAWKQPPGYAARRRHPSFS
jgi:tryptophan synthase alpha subunit